jgi:signal peptidase I
MRTPVAITGANRGTRSPIDGGARPDRALIVLGALAVALIAVLLLALNNHEPSKHPTIGPSMTPTILSGTTIDIDAHAYDGGAPQLDDIVGFQGPANIVAGTCGAAHPAASPCPVSSSGYERIRLVKRVIGLPGDRIAFTADGHSIRNGAVAAEPFIAPCPGTCALPQPIVVPEGHYFMAGDNRPMSTDSRVFGAVPLEAIDGRVILDGSEGGS